MIYGLGPRAQRVYTALREQILREQLVAGSKLPPHTELAVQFGVAPLTVRQVLARLEEEGLVSREQGRGTFVRRRSSPAVLVVEDDPEMRALIGQHIKRAGYLVIAAEGPAAGMAALESDAAVTLIFSDVRMPTADVGVDFIRTVRRRWPNLPLAALTGYPDDLAELHGTAECPILILAKPVWPQQIEEALRLALGNNKPAPVGG